jgi:hypothetical protein
MGVGEACASDFSGIDTEQYLEFRGVSPTTREEQHEVLGVNTPNSLLAQCLDVCTLVRCLLMRKLRVV